MAKNTTAIDVVSPEEEDRLNAELGEPDKTEEQEEQEEQLPETDQAEEELITPYKAAQVIMAELQLELPPQMIYTYVKNGAFGEEAKETKRITAKAAIEWGKALQERRNKRATKKTETAKKDLDQQADAQVTEVE
jgi:hypothetical protein